jgi:hypothetical protein
MSEELHYWDFTKAALDSVAKNESGKRAMVDPDWRTAEREVLRKWEALGHELVARPGASPFVVSIGEALTRSEGTWSAEDATDRHEAQGGGYKLLAATAGVRHAIGKAVQVPPEARELAAMRQADDRFWNAIAASVACCHA